MIDPEKYDRGLAARRHVLGDAYADGIDAAARDDQQTDEAVSAHFNSTFTHLATEHVWGAFWPRDGLDLRSRYIATIGILLVQGNDNELGLHFRAALKGGYLTREEIRELVLQSTGYAGYAVANEALKMIPEPGVA